MKSNYFAPEQQRSQLSLLRRKVDFDTYDVTVDELLRRVSRGRIDIAPVYQRQFRWDMERQSRLIESILLGIPVPPLFMATNSTQDVGSSWEVVDGLQRLLSLVNYAADSITRRSVYLNEEGSRLESLDKLTKFEGSNFQELPTDIQNALEDRPMKVVVLNDKSDLEVRFDLFERLNTGGIDLTDQEIRECVYRGDFVDMLTRLADSSDFRKAVKIPDRKQLDGTPQDFVLRFFAFLDRYENFDHSVKDFLNDYCAEGSRNPMVGQREQQFNLTFRFLSRCFPDGINRTKQNQTPVNLFEGVAVGAALALHEDPGIRIQVNPEWVYSEELRSLVTGATNSKPRVIGRINFCRDRFLDRSA